MKQAKKQLGSITILIDDRQNNSCELHNLLSKNGHLIMARLGVNVEPACIEKCLGLITITVKGYENDIKNLTKQINKLKGAKAKELIITK